MHKWVVFDEHIIENDKYFIQKYKRFLDASLYYWNYIEKFSFITIVRNVLYCLVFLPSYCKKDIGFFTQLLCCEIKDDFQTIAKFSFVTFDVITIKMSKGWRKSIGCLTLETIVCACKVLMIDSNCFYNHINKVFSMAVCR